MEKERTQQCVAVGGAGDGELAVNMMQNVDLHGVILKNFSANEDLIRWTAEFCSIGEPVQASFLYYEGQDAEPGENFHQQLKRQLEKDFQECQDYLLEEGLQKQALLTPPAVTALTSLIMRMMQLYDSCATSSRSKKCWKIKLEVNQDGACTKYHDDMVDVRFVCSLAGEGTVLADNDAIDWEYYDSLNGLLPKPEAGEDRTHAIKAFNNRVTKSELKTQPGDLTIMKGGTLTKRPCLHRAPYSADKDMAVARLLITVDRLCKDELDVFVENEIGPSEGSRNEQPQSEGSSNEQTQNAETTPAPPTTLMMTITVPEGVSEGQQLLLTGPSGERIKVQVPAGMGPGKKFQVKANVPAPAQTSQGKGKGKGKGQQKKRSGVTAEVSSKRGKSEE